MSESTARPAELVRRARGSIAYRSGRLAEAAVALFGTPSAQPNRPQAEFSLITLCGAKQLLMQQQSLRSMANAWREIPRLVAVSDGSLSASEISAALGWWPAPVTPLMPADVSAEARRSGHTLLANWAERALFGLKFAAVINAGSRGASLYCDGDVLWFRDVRPVIAAIENSADSVVFSMAEDYQPAYDLAVARVLCSDVATHAPYRNAGVMYLRGNLLDVTDLRPAITAAGQSHFAEQTTFAVAADRLASPVIPRSVIACHQHDADSLRVTYRGTDWVARHYVGPVRNLFWRDALALRLRLAQ